MEMQDGKKDTADEDVAIELKAMDDAKPKDVFTAILPLVWMVYVLKSVQALNI